MQKTNFAALFLLISLLTSSSLFAQNPGAYLGELTWPEAEQRFQKTPVVIIPFAGGAKEHGPHLPMNADQKVMEYLCQKAVEEVPVIVAPPVLHGWFAAFREYPGTEISDPDIFRQYLFEISKSLIKSGAQRIVFLNMGVTKASGLPIAIVAREVRVQYRTPTLLISWDDLETDEALEFLDQKMGGHADESETSINLFLQPDLVKMENTVTDYWDFYPMKKYVGYRPGLFSRDKNDPMYSETGHFGDPTLAAAEKGRKILEIMTNNWLNALRGFSKDPLPGKK